MEYDTIRAGEAGSSINGQIGSTIIVEKHRIMEWWIALKFEKCWVRIVGKLSDK